ncbi:MAG: sulfatase [Opitutus sp.]|nr:sulfatase [Opitutus sp.]
MERSRFSPDIALCPSCLPFGCTASNRRVSAKRPRPSAMTTSHFLCLIATCGLPVLTGSALAATASPRPPNVLFIAVDDLNDWIGPLRGHPQVKTPNIDRLAQRGVVFANAHCAAPLCNPSRAAVFSGHQPFETGVLANDEKAIRTARPDLVLIPQHFQQAGYRTYGSGKLLHQKGRGLCEEEFYPEQRWSPFTPEATSYTAAELPSKGTENPRHRTVLKGRPVTLPLNRMPSDRAAASSNGESFDWGPLEVDDADMGDGQIADWAVTQIRQQPAKPTQPWFLAVGFYRPHIPLFAPKKYFDLYAEIDIQLPVVKPDDLDDLSATGRAWARDAVTAGSHAAVVKYGQWKAAVTAYLACVSFVDAQVGKLLDALDASSAADNTVIVFWGDHGWHLGEKEHWGKWTGWQRATRVPFIVAPAKSGPTANFPRGVTCAAPVGLIDLYPTLIDLCGIAGRPGLAGQSLAPMLKNPATASDRHILTCFDAGNYSLTGPRWHYIRYADGNEELYDSPNDPHEWTNLAGRPEVRGVQQEMAGKLPVVAASSRDTPPPPKAKSGRKKKAPVP